MRLNADEFLLDHLGGGFDLMYFTSKGAIPEDILVSIKTARKDGFPLKVIAIGSKGLVEGADRVLPDELGRVRECYGINSDGGAYLLRPDQHVCARWVTVDETRLRSAFKQALIN